jgi:hypothetical protein
MNPCNRWPKWGLARRYCVSKIHGGICSIAPESTSRPMLDPAPVFQREKDIVRLRLRDMIPGADDA